VFPAARIHMLLEFKLKPDELASKWGSIAGLLHPQAARPDILAVERWGEDLHRGRHSFKAAYPAGEILIQNITVMELHGTAGPQYLKGAIKREERLQHVLFAPEAKIGHDELFWIIGRHKNVMHMDNHA